MIESKLHTPPPVQNSFPKFEKIDVFEAGADAGCEFCMLLIDAQRRWKQGRSLVDLRAQLYYTETAFELEISMRSERTDSRRPDAQTIVVFAEEGQYYSRSVRLV